MPIVSGNITTAGGGSGGFTPVYGGSYDITQAITTTTVSAINTDVNITYGTAATIEGTTGLTVVAGGGVQNTSGEGGLFECKVSPLTGFYNGGSKYRYIGARKQLVDTSYEAMPLSSVAITPTAGNTVPTVTCYLRLEPNEIAWACTNQITATAANFGSSGMQLALTRIA